MMTKEELEKATPEELDEWVHDVKSKEASGINNQGKEAQINYLLGGNEDGSYELC